LVLEAYIFLDEILMIFYLDLDLKIIKFL